MNELAHVRGEQVAVVSKLAHVRGEQVAVVNTLAHVRGEQVAVVNTLAQVRGEQLAVVNTLAHVRGEQVAVGGKFPHDGGEQVAVVGKQDAVVDKFSHDGGKEDAVVNEFAHDRGIRAPEMSRISNTTDVVKNYRGGGSAHFPLMHWRPEQQSAADAHLSYSCAQPLGALAHTPLPRAAKAAAALVARRCSACRWPGTALSTQKPRRLSAPDSCPSR